MPQLSSDSSAKAIAFRLDQATGWPRISPDLLALLRDSRAIILQLEAALHQAQRQALEDAADALSEKAGMDGDLISVGQRSAAQWLRARALSLTQERK